MIKCNDNKRASVKTLKAGHILSPFAAVYWQTRYLLLKHNSHRHLTNSHARLLNLAYSMADERASKEETAAALRDFMSEANRAVKIHHDHGYKRTEKKA